MTENRGGGRDPQHDPRVRRGMARQLRLRQARLDAGERALGWKVGFGAAASMAQLQIDAPLVGFLTDAARLPTGATVPIAGWVRPAIEPEIAVYLGQDVAAAADRETIRAAITAVGPAIELADISFPPADVADILAGNVYQRHVILGRPDPSRAGCLLDGLVGHIRRPGEPPATVTDVQALTGDLVRIVGHVADVLAACGETLRAGELVITGAIVPPIIAAGPVEIRYTLDPVDTISVRLNA